MSEERQISSGLLVVFSGPGMAEFTLQPLGQVTDGQIAALGASLTSRADFMLKTMLTEEMQRLRPKQADRRIEVPGVDPRAAQAILSKLSRGGTD